MLPFAATIGDEDAGNSGGVTPFLTKLYDLLLDPSTEQFICWGAGGQSIVINDALGLASDIIPRFWKHNNLRSFFRQLNTYGFQRASAHLLGKLEFYHEHFVRGRRDLLLQIPRGRVSRKRAFDETDDPGSIGLQASIVAVRARETPRSTSAA